MADESAHVRTLKFPRWVFTLNNYTTEEYDHVLSLADKVVYLVVGKEVGETGTPHLQGFLILSNQNRKTTGSVKNFLGSPRVHVEVAKAIEEAAVYCKKDNDYVEFGAIPAAKKGRRNDLEDFKDAVKSGLLSLKEVRESHAEVYAKYPRFCLEYLTDHLPQRDLTMHPFRLWQAELNVRLNRPADDRTIMFIVDKIGNTGKSWFCEFYMRQHDNVQILQPAKKADMAYFLDSTVRVLFLDCPRCKSDVIQYDFLEEIKNGRVFSSKYESRVKSLNRVHVVVMMNEHPDMHKLSEDRYSVTNLTEAMNRIAFPDVVDVDP